MLALLMFIYAVLGVQLFTFTQHQELLNDQRNFDSLGNAFLLLFQCLTADAWSTIMVECAIDEVHGCSAEAGDCGSSLAIPYFVSFQLFGSFVVLNLIVAVILENFSDLGKRKAHLASATDVLHFREVWSKFDPDGDGMVPSRQLTAIVKELPPPLGPETKDTRKVASFCINLGLPEHNGQIR